MTEPTNPLMQIILLMASKSKEDELQDAIDSGEDQRGYSIMDSDGHDIS